MKKQFRNYSRMTSSTTKTEIKWLSSVMILDFNFFIKLLGGSLAIVVLMYGYLISQTVTITAEYKNIESRIMDASTRLTEASAQMVIIEEYIASLEAGEHELSAVSEPNAFVSRSENTDFTFNY